MVGNIYLSEASSCKQLDVSISTNQIMLIKSITKGTSSFD